ncbi:MAG TPA: valine--tRNA ligase [Candidatus Sulfotelmatobacter sp.]|nr:valine--tRNA ligase [Candidatus Sulfotelmatobacter sp.]
MLDKTYQPGPTEAKHYARWESSGAFAAHPESSATPFTIMMPPPNVTGSLHMGHALTFTLQDVLIRYWRARGRDALWQPGTDHAGIATQMVVERQLATVQESRVRLGREKFLDRVWAWKQESGGTITRQLRRLGASPDWSRERFTMDEGLSRAVRKVFVELYRRGLIYRDKRLVNWDPRLHTAVSDLEVEQHEVKGSLWYIKYPLEGAPDSFITVATTRPETMLGDTGIAVHPDDPRYRHLIGQHAILPLVGRRIPIVADEYSDPEKGSGAVKITPAHDFNDFEVGKRHGLALINIFDRDACLNDAVPEAYRGLARFDARKRVVADLEAAGLLDRIEPQLHAVPHGDRSGEVLEPWLTDQWFADAKKLAEAPIKAVETGATVFVPKQWEATFFEWMRNIQPWCISRQIWWGHQIPAWFGPDGAVFVAETEAEAAAAARDHYGKDEVLTRDPDVLDTWFSSALWPFSTLGWPDEAPSVKRDLARYYPTDVLVTGFDIIFFWVARMMMMGHAFMDDVPFRTVYIHALVRDERGQKMSKSKGNIIDPLELIDKYGSDALRFTLAALAVPGRDVKLAASRVEGYRNFATKLWNAARYAEMNACAPDPAFDPARCRETVNRWIVGALAEVGERTARAIETYRFDEAANGLYQFIWGTFCDWYLEFTKPILTGPTGPAQAETRATTAWVLRQVLHFLHPLMPFITEELWEQLGFGADGPLILAHWPSLAAVPRDAEAAAEMDWVVQAIAQVRGVRSEMNVPAAAQLKVCVADAAATTQGWMATHADAVKRLARLVSFEPGSASGQGTAQIVVGEATLFLDLAGVVDLGAERARLGREIDRLAKEVAKFDAKLANPGFRAKADPEVVAETEERRDETEATRRRLEAALARLN